MATCEKCGTDNPGTAASCKSCGASLQPGLPAPASRTSPLMITVCIALLFGLGYGGGFLWLKAQQRADSQKPATPPMDSIAAVPVPTPVPVAEAEAPLPAAHPDTVPIVAETADRKNSPTAPAKPVVVSRPAATTTPAAARVLVPPAPDAMPGKIASLLARADGYLDKHQYDKAIATAESALELEPANTAASAMVKKAKARQLEALKNDSSLN